MYELYRYYNLWWIINYDSFYNLTYLSKNKSNGTSIDPTVHPVMVQGFMDRRSNDKDVESKLNLLSSAVLSLNRKVRNYDPIHRWADRRLRTSTVIWSGPLISDPIQMIFYLQFDHYQSSLITSGLLVVGKTIEKIVILESLKLVLQCINKNLETSFQLNNLSNCSFQLHTCQTSTSL